MQARATHRALTRFAGVAVQIVQQLGSRREAAILPQAPAGTVRLPRLPGRAVGALCALLLRPAVGGRAPAEVCQRAQLLLQPPRVQRDLKQAGAPALQRAPPRAAPRRHRLHPGAALPLLQLLQGGGLPL